MAVKLTNFDELTDEQLIDEIKNGSEAAQDYLIGRYKNLVKIKSRQYFIVGADKEDIVQEGMIGLYKAIQGYDKSRQATFGTFSELCITRQILTAIKTATRQKHMPLNSYVSLNKPVTDDDNENTYIDLIISTRIISPEELLIGREEKRSMEFRINECLSELECKVLSLYLRGSSYAQMSAALRKDEKAVDNALQRIRKKVEKIYLDTRS